MPPRVTQATRIAELEAQVAELAAAPAAAPAAGVGHRPLRLPDPPSFDPNNKDHDVNAWIFAVDNYFSANPQVISNDTRVRYSVTLLKGAAMWWWKSQVERELVQCEIFEKDDPWVAFKSAVRQRFQIGDVVQMARREMWNIHQISSPAQFASKLQQIALRIPDMTDAELKDRFMHGLKSQTRAEVALRNPTTFDEAVTLAITYDNAMYQNKQSAKKYGKGNGYKNGQKDAVGLNSIQKGGWKKVQKKKGKLSPEKREKLFSEGRCFHCEGKGHRSYNCPQKNKETEPTVKLNHIGVEAPHGHCGKEKGAMELLALSMRPKKDSKADELFVSGMQ